MTANLKYAPPDSDERVITLAKPSRPLYRESSMAAAIEALRECESASAVPVLDGPFLLGMVWASELRAAALSGTSLETPVCHFMDTRPPKLLPNASLEEARAVLTSSGAPALAVADAEGRYVGVLAALDLYRRSDIVIRPPFIGGMATPFGVFLTNGEVSGGAGPAALMATGAMLFGMLALGLFATFQIVEQLSPHFVKTFGAHLAEAQSFVLAVMPSIFFFVFLRALPLSGTHGAEHMVVHAIERREPLTLDVVRRMPRVHPRCGTNLAIGAMLFMWLVGLSWDAYRELGALFALVATVLLWRPLGAIFQTFVTTKTPSRTQLEGAIKAGEELLVKYKHSVRGTPNFGRRLLMSGLPWVMTGSLLASVLLYLILKAVHVNPAYFGLG